VRQNLQRKSGKNFMFNSALPADHAVYEIMCFNTVEPDIVQMTV
jgi:hypothetical protein